MDVVFVLPRTRRSGLVNVMELLACALDARVIHLDEGRGYSIPRLQRVWSELRDLKRSGTRVHSSGFFPDLLNASSGRQLASTTLHGFLGPEYALIYGRIRGRVIATLHALVARMIPLRLACSASVECFLRARYGLETRVCVNGCRSHPGTLVTPALALHDEGRTYYFAGPFITRKQVVPAVSAVLDGDLDATFTAFGSGPDGKRLEDLKRTSGRVTIATVHDPTEHYRAGHFYMSFSTFEGMPLGVIEALRCGCIPVLSTIPPHEEVLELLGLPSLRCFQTPSEGVAWAKQLRAIDREALARDIRRRADELFSPAAFAARFHRAVDWASPR